MLRRVPVADPSEYVTGPIIDTYMRMYPKASGLERELKMVQLSTTRCRCIAIL
jgi:hypothetical protein